MPWSFALRYRGHEQILVSRAWQKGLVICCLQLLGRNLLYLGNGGRRFLRNLIEDYHTRSREHCTTEDSSNHDRVLRTSDLVIYPLSLFHKDTCIIRSWTAKQPHSVALPNKYNDLKNYKVAPCRLSSSCINEEIKCRRSWTWSCSPHFWNIIISTSTNDHRTDWNLQSSKLTELHLVMSTKILII
jgi:hypothetical protein